MTIFVFTRYQLFFFFFFFWEAYRLLSSAYFVLVILVKLIASCLSVISVGSFVCHVFAYYLDFSVEAHSVNMLVPFSSSFPYPSRLFGTCLLRLFLCLSLNGSPVIAIRVFISVVLRIPFVTDVSSCFRTKCYHWSYICFIYCRLKIYTLIFVFPDWIFKMCWYCCSFIELFPQFTSQRHCACNFARYSNNMICSWVIFCCHDYCLHVYSMLS